MHSCLPMLIAAAVLGHVYNLVLCMLHALLFVSFSIAMHAAAAAAAEMYSTCLPQFVLVAAAGIW